MDTDGEPGAMRMHVLSQLLTEPPLEDGRHHERELSLGSSGLSLEIFDQSDDLWPWAMSPSKRGESPG